MKSTVEIEYERLGDLLEVEEALNQALLNLLDPSTTLNSVSIKGERWAWGESDSFVIKFSRVSKINKEKV